MLLVHNISKVYRLYRHPSDRLRAALPLLPQTAHSDFWALRGITFSVERGETVGLLGPNGCGKSTLLQIISGILQPTTGRVVVKGRVAALLELGAGFNPEFTGRENVRLNGELMGLSRKEVERAIPDIERFAEIGEFIDRPVKEYSSGMYVRLAFAAAIHVDPDVLVVDEALAVGDAIFANRCVRKLEELRRQKVTILFVSHDLSLVKQLSDRAILLLGGRIAAEGNPHEVVNRYVAHVHERRAETEGPNGDTAGKTPPHRHGDGASEITEVALLDSNGVPCESVPAGAPVIVRIRCLFHQDVEEPMVGVLIRNRIGTEVFGTNTGLEGVQLGTFHRTEELRVEFRFDCWLTPQQYTLTVATQHKDGFSQDWLDDVLTLKVVGSPSRAGCVDLRAKVSWDRNPANP